VEEYDFRSSGVETAEEYAAILSCLSFLHEDEKARPTNRAIVSAACEGVKITHGEIENKVPAQAELHHVP
jgi:hypothetical protein